MLKETAKAMIVLAGSVVAVPYTVAFIANLLKGWPLGPDKYRRAFHPRKVFALNYALLQQLKNLKYTWLYFKWKSYYAHCSHARLLKDLPFGNNENTLDLYFPRAQNPPSDQGAHGAQEPMPVVVFLYGGSWSSGDKNMYSLLCSRIADQLQAIVCCPNYSLYPRGYMDDMVQDVVDCLGWIHSNIDTYRGDKDRIMLIGHSAGAHLCMMAALELTLKRLLYNPGAIIMPEGFVPQAPQLQSLGDPIRFHERYFDFSSNDDEGSETVTPPVMLSGTATPPVLTLRSGPSTPPLIKSSGSATNSGPFYMVNTPKELSSLESDPEAFYLINKDNADREKEETESDTVVEQPEETDVADSASEEVTDTEKKAADEAQEGANAEETAVKEPTEEEAEVNAAQSQSSELVIEDSDVMTPSQRDVRDLLNSIKHIVGLAGVYDIGDHYDFESWRGVEDISAMARAAYGLEHFGRFSPTHIVSSLPPRTRLPPMTLIHGDSDTTVPSASTRKYRELCNQLSAQVNECVLRDCDHTDVCLDLMDPERDFYEVVMGLITQVAQAYL